MPFSIIKFAVTEILVKWLNVIHSHKPKKENEEMFSMPEHSK